MATSEYRLLEIGDIIGDKLIEFMENNIIGFGLDKDEQAAVIITTLTRALASFMGCVSNTHTQLDELTKMVIANMNNTLNVSRKSISRRKNDDT